MSNILCQRYNYRYQINFVHMHMLRKNYNPLKKTVAGKFLGHKILINGKTKIHSIIISKNMFFYITVSIKNNY